MTLHTHCHPDDVRRRIEGDENTREQNSRQQRRRRQHVLLSNTKCVLFDIRTYISKFTICVFTNAVSHYAQILAYVCHAALRQTVGNPANPKRHSEPAFCVRSDWTASWTLHNTFSDAPPGLMSATCNYNILGRHHNLRAMLSPTAAAAAANVFPITTRVYGMQNVFGCVRTLFAATNLATTTPSLLGVWVGWKVITKFLLCKEFQVILTVY